MKPDSTQLSAISRLFSSSVFREMAKKGRSPLFARLFKISGLSFIQQHETVGTAFEAAFAVLRKSGIRNEYVYRSALTHNILLGRHSLNTANMLTEFRAGSCKADLVILNGTAAVYEIKSDRDSLSRLSNQIANYRKVFAKIYIIAGELHIQQVLESTPSDIGVMGLARWDRIRTWREAGDRPDLVCPTTIFESLRVNEAQSILARLGLQVPDVPNTVLRTTLRQYFSQLDPVDLHREMVFTLKQSRNLAPLRGLIDKLPTSLKPAALSISVRQGDHERLIKAVSTPIHEAITWA